MSNYFLLTADCVLNDDKKSFKLMQCSRNGICLLFFSFVDIARYSASTINRWDECCFQGKLRKPFSLAHRFAFFFADTSNGKLGWFGSCLQCLANLFNTRTFSMYVQAVSNLYIITVSHFLCRAAACGFSASKLFPVFCCNRSIEEFLEILLLCF